MEKNKTTGPMSIVPGPMKEDHKTFLIQNSPFFELGASGPFYSGATVKGSQCCLYFNQNNVDAIKPMLNNMVSLIENDVPFVMMGFGGTKFFLLHLRSVSLSSIGTQDPKLFLERMRPSVEIASIHVKEDTLESWDKYIKDLIEKKEPLTGMRADQEHEVYVL